MKIGFITHWYDPEGGAAAGPGTIARALRDRGHDVSVVTGFPIYPSGNISEGYKLRPYQHEVLDGIDVHRSLIYPSHDDSPLKRMANYASFAMSSILTAMAVLRRCDVVFVYSTPATVGLPAVVLKMLIGMPFVVQIQDLWPDTVTQSEFASEGSRNKMHRILGRFCNSVYKHASSIAVTSPGMAALLDSRGVESSKVSVVPNWADEKSFYPTKSSIKERQHLGIQPGFTVMYAGNLGQAQDLQTVVRAASLVRERADINFVLVGSGVAEASLRAAADELKLTNLHFVESQPFSAMADVLASADVQLVTLRDVPLYRATLPSKLQAILAAGRPVIAAVAGDGGQVVSQAKAGIAIPPSDAAAMADAAVRLSEMSVAEREAMGTNGRNYYLENFSETVLGDRLSDLLVSAAASRST